MKDLQLQQLIKKFKHDRQQEYLLEKESVLHNIDVSINTALPNSLLFECDTLSNINTFVDFAKLKSSHKIKTNELYYNNGILGNLYNINNCDYNWVLSYVIFNQYHHLFNNSINCFHIGFGNGGFISGMEYFFTNSKSLNDDIYESIYEINWLGTDIKHNKFSAKYRENIIHGFKCDDLILYNNLNHVKIIIENNMIKINLLTNNVIPNLKNNKILISTAILALTVLSNNGLLLTRIVNPEYWSGDFINYILLFGMIFKNMEICRYPICKKSHIKYRYYLICHKKKHILHNSNIHRRLILLLKNNDTEKLIFLSDVIDNDEVNAWKSKILLLQQTYINSSDNPRDDLNEILKLLTRKLIPSEIV
jgi:hypothetical protein